MVKQWRADAPANIAIVKYMGKTDASVNEAMNPSLSMTLGKFLTTVEISHFDGNLDIWEPLAGSDLPAKAGERFLRFFNRIKPAGLKGAFRIRSGNNFPSDCGLASSASSFAALTRASELCFAELEDRDLRSPSDLARISRTGSGSSCRSFFSPWCAWEGDRIEPVEARLNDLVDCVVILTASAKKVSSSEAHKRVQTSPLIDGRAERAQGRQEKLRQALATGSYKDVAEIAWAELWEMHSLFHTASPPFWYLGPDSLRVLRFVDDLWEKEGDGPIATVDAGPNIHLLLRPENRERTLALLTEALGDRPKVLESGA